MRRILLLTLGFMALSVKAQQWVLDYQCDEGVILVGGSCNGDGNYIFGAWNNDELTAGYLDAYALFVDKDGGYVERKFSFEGYKSHLCNSICLENGDAFVVGVKGGALMDHVYDTLWVSVMTPDLEIIEEHDYPLVEPYKTWTTDVYLDFNNQGEIVVLADVSEKDYPMITNGVYAVFKFDTHGNMTQSKYFADGHGVNGARPTGISRVPGSDNMMMLGKGFFATNCHSICYIDNDLNKIAAYPLPWLEDKWNYTDCWKDNGHFLMSSMTHHHGVVNNPYYAAVFEVDEMGRYIDTLVYDRADTSDYTAQFGSMAYVDDNVIYIATYWESGLDETPTDAVVCMIDEDLNLRGTKRLRMDDTKIRLKHCQKTSDGGCLVYGQCIQRNSSERVVVWKLLPEDFVIPWELSEKPEVLPEHQAYPNPTGNYINIILDNVDNQGCKIVVGDIRGLKYFERQFDGEGVLTLDVSSLETGMYYYEVIIGGHSVQKERFIKIKY